MRWVFLVVWGAAHNWILILTDLQLDQIMAQIMELTPAEIARNVNAHPTLNEALIEAAHDAEGHAIHM